MKILVIQMLRLGDIIMSAPVISGLQKKYPNAEIHILGFKNFRHVEALFVDKVIWHWIDREELQRAIGDADVSFFHASDLLEKQLKPLRELKFDCIYNLTQTKMSGWVCNYIRAPQIVGLHFDDRGLAQFGSSWFRYLNDHMAAGQGEIFHYLDLYRFGCELENEKPEWNFRREPCAAPTSRSYILAQVTTSDAKKTYPLALWRKAFEAFSSANPTYEIGVLAAPDEAAALTAAFASMPQVRILKCSLGEALALMDGAGLLVTGDTSIKHLACASAVPVLELSLGSSDFRKTGVYKSGSWILQGRVACSPCPHSSPCSQPTHQCALQIQPEALALAMQKSLQADADISNQAKEFEKSVCWHETFVSPVGIWMTRDFYSPSTEDQWRWSINRLIEKSTWKFVLQREFLNPLASYGSESLAIFRTYQERIPDLSLARFRDQLDFLETETTTTDQCVHGLKHAMRRLLEKPMSPDRQEECLEAVRDFCETESKNVPSIRNWLSGFSAESVWPMAGKKIVPFIGLRRLQTNLDEIFRRTQVKLKLIRSLKSHMSEKQ